MNETSKNNSIYLLAKLKEITMKHAFYDQIY